MALLSLSNFSTGGIFAFCNSPVWIFYHLKTFVKIRDIATVIVLTLAAGGGNLLLSDILNATFFLTNYVIC